MTDIQFKSVIKMIIEIVREAESKEDALEKLEALIEN